MKKPTKLSSKEIQYREKLNELWEQQSSINKKILWYKNKLGKELEKKYSYIKDMTIDNADWKELLHVNSPENETKYNKCRDLVYKLGFYPSGYYSDTSQYSINIKINTSCVKDSIKKTLESLKIILPFIVPRKHESGKKYKTLDIFCDHTFGIPVLLIRKDGTSCVEFTHLSRSEMKTKWNTLEETLKYIGKYHPYEDD